MQGPIRPPGTAPIVCAKHSGRGKRGASDASDGLLALRLLTTGSLLLTQCRTTSRLFLLQALLVGLLALLTLLFALLHALAGFLLFLLTLRLALLELLLALLGS